MAESKREQKLMPTEKSFEIKAVVYALGEVNGKESILNNIQYIIPVYQRPYSWGEDQVRKSSLN